LPASIADHIATPNIDQLGAEGVIFQEGYVTSPTCAPYRTGYHQIQLNLAYLF
jgi:arylsulfatase A-like enzyme